MNTTLEVLLSPAEFTALLQRDLRGTTCVVFDVLRATSSMITALANGAEAIIPVAEISEALAIRERQPDVLLAGERDGVRIRRDLTGSIDFDLGNSPREFTADKVAGKTIVMTTTNGTRALRACAAARSVLVGSFLNLSSLARQVRERRPAHLMIVCSGTHEEAAYEDLLAAGALCEALWTDFANGHVSDSAQVARQIYNLNHRDLVSAMTFARNGRRLLSIPELAEDVAFCLRLDAIGFCGELHAGRVVRL